MLTDDQELALLTIQKFLDGVTRRDDAAMRACLTKATLESGQFSGMSPDGVTFEIGEPTMEGTAVLIPVKGTQADAPEGTPSVMELPCLVVKEDGEWKFDLAATMEKMMGGNLDAALSTAVTAMGDAMSKMTESLGNAMSEAFGNSSDADAPAVDYLNAPLDYAPEELFPLLNMTLLPRLTASLTSVCGHPVTATAAVADFLRAMGSNETQTLIDWFDTQLFDGWVSMLATLDNRLPASSHLAAFRVEPASSVDNRMLLLDGNSLVYRMYLPVADGYYSDAEIETILPAVIAALPPKDTLPTDKRTIHLDHEPASLELYKDRAAPRIMRRISELLGKNIRLTANFDDLFNPPEDARQLYRWALNRVHGALALTCRDPARAAALKENFREIHISLVSNISDRAAEFDGSTLTLALYYFPGEIGCFYEKDLVSVLDGNPIRYQSADQAFAEASIAAVDTQDDDSAEETQRTDAERAQQLNNDNFTSAAASLNDTIPTWEQQLSLILSRHVHLTLDFDSLNNDFELIQPFIHQGLTATIEAVTRLAFDPVHKPLTATIDRVAIRGAATNAAVQADLTDGTLTVLVPLVKADIRPPTAAVVEALTALQPPASPAKAAKKPAKGKKADAAPKGAKPKKAAKAADIYKSAEKFADDLEEALRGVALWPGKPPKKLVVKGAFGEDNLSFDEWLAWVFIPRIRQTVKEKGEFPEHSNVGAYAIRRLGDQTGGPEIISLLSEFDALVNELPH